MTTKYVTLKKNDPLFAQYLLGDFKDETVALPVKTYNLGTTEEMVTFEVLKKAEIEKPSFFVFISTFLKLNSFVLIFLPLLFILTKNISRHDYFDVQGLCLAAISMFFLFSGLNIRNDINDHVSGFDRVNIDQSVKPIKNGWINVKKASYFSFGFILVAIVFAIPILIVHPEILNVVVPVALLFIAGKFLAKNLYKQQHFGELILFFLMGPALVSGYQLSAGVSVDNHIIFFGILWGALVLYVVQLNNFSHIMTSTQAGIQNTMTRLGFDSSQKFIVIYWLLMLVIWNIYQYLFFDSVFAILSTLGLLVISINFFKITLNIKSPMGSGLRQVRKQGYLLFLTMTFLLCAEYFYILWK